MSRFYAETIGLCPTCAKDCPAFYEQIDQSMILNVECGEHGLSNEQVERDSSFFRWNYEQEYKRTFNHLVLPITYQCNINCRYCYTMSNSSFALPADRPLNRIIQFVNNFDGNITYIGGEPSIRKDLFQLIRIAKEAKPRRKISIATNGQILNSLDFVKQLKNSGIDFVFLNFDDIEYIDSKIIHQNKVMALNNCEKLQIPVWIQRTISELSQLDSLLEPLEIYHRVIFNVTIRTVKPFGIYYPPDLLFISDILKYLKKENNYSKGSHPFNNVIDLKKKKVKVSSWVLDMNRLDSLDSNYILSNDVFTTLHRGTKMDEVLIKNNNLKFKPSFK